MLKKISCVVIVLFFSSELLAQELNKEWNEGKLTWQDFTERESDFTISELKYFLAYHTEKKEYGDTIVNRYKATCYINKNFSWINPAFKIEQYLRYNQVIFNLVEIHRRKLQYELDRLNYYYESEGKFNTIYASCNSEIEKFKKDSNEGRLVNAIDFWEHTTNEELKSYRDSKIPDFENKNFGYGMHAGLGTGVFTGSLSEHFSPTFNIIFGFDFAYKKSILFLNLKY